MKKDSIIIKCPYCNDYHQFYIDYGLSYEKKQVIGFCNDKLIKIDLLGDDLK